LSPRKTITRLNFNGAEKYIGIFDEQKNEEKLPVTALDGIYKYSEKLKLVIRYYDAQKSQDFKGKTLCSFTFKGKRYETKYWKDMMLQVSKMMSELHGDKFESVLGLSGRKKPFFSKNPGDLRSAEKIGSTDIYAETNLSAESMVKLSKSLLTLFGYQESDLSMEIQ